MFRYYTNIKNEPHFTQYTFTIKSSKVPQCYHVTNNLYSNAKKKKCLCYINTNYFYFLYKKVGIKIQFFFFFFYYHEDNAMKFFEIPYYTILMPWYMNMIIIQYHYIQYVRVPRYCYLILSIINVLTTSKYIQYNL